MPSEFIFHGDLPDLLKPRWKPEKKFIFTVNRRASVKDVIESYGIPHTEVGRIESNGQQVGFSFLVEDELCFNVSGIEAPWDVTRPTLLRPLPLKELAFVVDVNVGRLAKYLRMAGFDTLYDYQWDDCRIVDIVEQTNRIVLSRDMGLLKRKQVEFGRYVRAVKPVDQLEEIVSLFDLAHEIKPFSRCLDCNTLLDQVDKKDILSRLEPLTVKYYNSFSLCRSCNKIYWPGSHREKMEKLLTSIVRVKQ